MQRQRCCDGAGAVPRWWHVCNRGNDTLRMERVSAATEHARTKYATELFLGDFIRRT